MSKRRALLIGVPKYINKAIPPLLFIENDVKRLHEALESAGYQVESIGTGKNLPATPGVIRKAVYGFCSKADKDETLLLCFSGHGVHFDGNDYLVPCDATIEDPDIKSYLFPLNDFNKSAENSKAEAIFFFIDACREGIELGTMGVSSIKLWGTQKLQISKERDIAFIFSCGPGEVSHYVAKPEAFSLFSRALAETISVNNPAMTFREVTDEIQKKLKQLAKENGKPIQSVIINSEFKIDFETDTRNNRLFNRIILDKASRYNPQGKPLRRTDEKAKEIRALLLKFNSEGHVHDSIVFKAIEIMDTKSEDLTEENILYDALLDELSTIPIGKFVGEWFNIKIKYLEKAHRIEAAKGSPLPPIPINIQAKRSEA